MDRENYTSSSQVTPPQRHTFQKKLGKFFVGDIPTWIIFLFFMLASTIAVSSAISQDAFKAEEAGGSFYGVLFRHFLYLGGAFFAVLFLSRVKISFYKRWTPLFVVGVIVLLFVTLIAGTELNEGKRWVRIFGITLQPSELAKVALVLHVAYTLGVKEEYQKSLKTTLWLWVPIGLITLFIITENISTAALILAISFILSFIGGSNRRHILYLLLGGITVMALFLSIKVLFFEHAEVGRSTTGKGRIVRFVSKIGKPINEETYDDIMGKDYQVVSAQKAIANSGITGKGAYRSELRQFLPAAYSDYIYNVIVEEYGIFGAGFILMFYLMFFWRCGRLARVSPLLYYTLLLHGAGIVVTTQALMNLLVANNLLPVTGQTLPFISKGGSSYLFMSVLFGIVLAVSRELKEKMEQQDAQMTGIEGMPVVEMNPIPGLPETGEKVE